MRTLLFVFALAAAIACGDANQKDTSSSAPIAETQPQLVNEMEGTTPSEVVKPVSVQEVDVQPVAKKTKERVTKTTKPEAKTPSEQESTVPKKTVEPVNEPVVTEPKPSEEKPKEEKPAAQQPPSHEAWNKLLGQYVSADGKVNYKGLKTDKAQLENYLETLKNNPPQNDWKRNEKMAFWINAYNAFTVKLILDNYPLTSITKLENGKPWDKKWIKIGDKTYSLNNIENDILRPQFKDARIHFAVNCAAKSCPPLLNKAWTADNLESNFEKQAKAFINNPKFNTISAKNVKVSKIFEWYAADFGNLVDYLNKYSTTKINNGAKVEYAEYDWSLNE